MASVYARLGTKVTVVEYMDKLCPFLDDDIADSFKKILTKQGLTILTGHKVTGGKNNGTSGEVTIEPVKGGESKVLKGDHILISTGRRPYSEGLGAKEVGVNFDEHNRVVIDNKFKSSVDGIYAVGDIVAGPMLAHKAEEEGCAVVDNIMGKDGHVNYGAIPSVIYTHPEVATVG